MTANAPYDRDAFFSAVLNGLGLGVTEWRLNFFREWARFENTGAGYNPLATTRNSPTVRVHSDWNDNGGVPVKNYATFADGVRATVETLTLTYYTKVRASLAAERVLEGAGEEIRDSWGTVHYGEQLIAGAAVKVYAATRVSGPPVPAPITLGYLGTWGTYYTPERPHLGIDFGSFNRTPFVSPYLNPSVRVHAIHRVGDGWGDGSFGNMLVLDIEGTEFYAGFAHLSRIDVDFRQIIMPGQQLGLTGATGFVEGDHLHWQHSADANFSRTAKTENPLGFVIAEPEPVIPTPIVSNPHAVERLNAAIQLRMAVTRIANDPDLAIVEQAAAALRGAGFKL